MQNPLIAHLSPLRDPFLPSSHLVDPSPLLLALSLLYQLSLLPLSLVASDAFLLFSSSSPPCMFCVERKAEKIPRGECVRKKDSVR